MRYAIPRTMNEVPSVTMNAGTFRLAMMAPLTEPTTAAAPTPAINPIRTEGKKRQSAIESEAEGERRKDRGEAHHPSDRQVDAGADNDEGLAQSEQEHRNDRDQNVLGIADGEKIDRAAAGQRHGDDEKKHHQGKEKPCPDAAGEENETLHGSADAGGRRPGGRNSSRPAIGHAAISKSAAPCEGAPIDSIRASLFAGNL